MANEDFTVDGDIIKVDLFDNTALPPNTGMVSTEITIDALLDKIGIDKINEYIQKKKQN